MAVMYPAKINSPVTTLDGGINNIQTIISLVDTSILPAAPNLASIGTGEDTETILYETINGNDLEDVTREFQGTAKAWDSGTPVARLFTAYDLDTLRTNVGGQVARPANYVVAANGAPTHVKAQADYECDGTDDHVQIQAAIDALPATGGKVLLTEGTFNIESAITLDSYQTLQGMGRSTILTTTTANLDIITATGSSGSEKTGIMLGHFTINGNSDTSDIGILFTYVDKSSITNLYTYDTDEDGIKLVTSDHNTINDCFLTNSDGDCGIMLDGSSDNVIFNNHCDDNYEDGILLDNASNNNIVASNSCSGNTTAGVSVGTSGSASEYNVVSSNICRGGNTSAGIYLDALSSHTTVSGNTVVGGGGSGIELGQSDYNIVSSNYIVNCAKYGIYLDQDAGVYADHNEIIGNFCIANSQDADNSYDDIEISGSYNNIQGNLCRAGGETNKPAYGIEIYDSNCVGNKVVNNDIYDDGFSTSAYLDDGTSTIYLEPEDTRDFLRYFGNRTLLSGGAITAHGDADGSVAIAACTAWCKETDADSADGVFFSYAGKAKQTLTDLSVNIIYLDYNAGTPQIVVATAPVTYGFQQDHILIGVVFRQGTAVHIFKSDLIGIQGMNRSFMHEVEHHGAHRSSGLVTTDGGTLALAITTGVLYAGLTRHTTTIDGTSWSYWYTTDSGSTWAEDTSQSALVQSYNNIASGKVALTSNRYGVHWVYVDYEGSHCHIVYGQGDYTASGAEEALVPSVLPPIVTSYGVLIAKIINQEGTNDMTITYPWTTVFVSSMATDHGSLGGLSDDDHTQYIKHSLATAVSDFLVASGVGVFIKKTLAEVKTLLGLAGNVPAGTAENDFIVAGAFPFAWAKKTLAQVRAILSEPSKARAYRNGDWYLASGGWIRVPLNAATYDNDSELDVTSKLGTADATEANKLHDADGGFEAGDVGKWLYNSTDYTYTQVTGFVDSGELDLADDIMANGEGYELYASTFTAKKAGWYDVKGVIRCSWTLAGAAYFAGITKSGSFAATGGFQASAGDGIAYNFISGIATDIIYCDAGDVLSLMAFHTEGNPGKFRGETSQTYFAVHRLS